MDTPVKITLKQWQDMEDAPGAIHYLMNFTGGMCANGKMNMLFFGQPTYPDVLYSTGMSDLIDVASIAAQLNNGTYAQTVGWHTNSITKSHPQWNDHIRAFRMLLMKYVELGYVELESDLVIEFNKIKETAECI